MVLAFFDQRMRSRRCGSARSGLPRRPSVERASRGRGPCRRSPPHGYGCAAASAVRWPVRGSRRSPNRGPGTGPGTARRSDPAGERSRLKRRLQQLHVVAIGTVRELDRDAHRFGEDRSFRPPLARSVGFEPVLGPPSGALVIAPSAARTTSRSRRRGRTPAAPGARSHERLRPAPARGSDGAPTTTNTSGRVERGPLPPGPEHQQDRLHCVAVGHPPAMPCQRVNGAGDSSGSTRSHNHSAIR